MDAADVIIETPKGVTLTDEQRRHIGLVALVRAGIVPDSWKNTPAYMGAKYSPDQPRDDHGRFSSGGGSGGSAIIGVPSFGDLSPRLQGKMAARLEKITGLPFDQLTAEMRNNLGEIAAKEWKTDPSTAMWYHQYHDAALAKVDEINAINAPGAPTMTEPKYEAMMSVTSALNDPKDNLTIVNGWAKMLSADPSVHVSRQALDNYEEWASSRKAGRGPFVESTLAPGDYRLSEIPSYMVPSMVRQLPEDEQPDYALNTGNLVKAVEIYRGTPIEDVIGGPKQTSFYNNLTDPDDPSTVTVDKWMYRAAIGDVPLTRDTKAYGSITQPIADWETDTRFGGKVTLSDGSTTRSGASPQDFFQGTPSSKPDNWPGEYGVYPVFVQAISDASRAFNDAHGTSLNPSEFQALVWAGVQR